MPGSEKKYKDGSLMKPAKYEKLWCPVIQGYQRSDTVTAAHLAPNALGPSLLTYLTGTPVETTMLVGNGILLDRSIEEELDNGNVAIIPVGNIEDPVELKLVIIDESLRSVRFGNGTWDVFDGRVLKFKNSARPQKRFLYLRYAMTMLYALRHKRPGYESLQSNIWPSRIIWASPGKYVRKSSIQVIAGLIGEHFTETFDDEEDPHSSSEIHQNLTAKFRAVVDGMPNCDSDSDDDDDEY